MRTRYSLINMITGIGGQCLSIILAFTGRMIFIKYLSAEYLGINGLFTNVLGMLGLAELGIGSAMIYSLYKPAAENDQDRISRLMNLYKYLYRGVAVVILILGLLLLPFLGYLMKGNPEIEHLEIIYLMYLFNSVVSYLYSYKNSILLAYQKAYYRIFWEHLIHLFQIVLQIIVLIATGNFLLYLFLQMLNQFSVNYIVAKKVDREYPYLKEQKGLPGKEERKTITKNIMAMSLHRIGGAVVFGTDNLIISAFVGLKSVGIYSNYKLIYSHVNTLMNKVYGAFSTSIGNLAATEERDKVYEIYRVLDFLMYVLYGYLAVGLFVMINPLIKLLFGQEYLFSVTVVLIMMIDFYLNGMRQINLQFRGALGLFWYDRYKPLAESVINLVVSVVLVHKYGVMGVLIGTIVSCLLTSFWTEPYIFMKYGIKENWKKKLKHYFVYYIYRTGWVVLSGGISFYICSHLGTNTILWFLVKCMICTVIYFGIITAVFFKTKEFRFLAERVFKFVKKD